MFTQASIGMEEAQRAADAVLAALTPDDNPAALAIARADGALILCLRQDGAPSRMLRRARAKAYTATRVGMNTVDFRDGVVKATNRTLDDWGDEGLTTLQGGMTVRSGGRVVGAIAMSGNTTQRDEQLAGIGLAAMGVK
ncbi:MAG: heme-binding protein [Chloroflexota bacterium]